MTRNNDNPHPSSDPRFKKGKSGNPKGRPKKKRRSEVPEHPLAKLSEMVFKANFLGVERELTAKELQQLKVLEKAFGGNLKAVRQVLSWMEKRRKEQLKSQTKGSTSCLKLEIETVDPQNANEALLAMDIICEREEGRCGPTNSSDYQMQPWCVEAALRRRRGTKRIDSENLSSIIAYTRDGSSVKLPRRYKNG